MNKNMGSADKAVRISLALLFAILIFAEVVSGFLAVVLGIFAVVFLLTSFVGFCPLYAIFKMSTIKKSA